MQLVSVDLCASERALKALHFAFRGVGIALAGATTVGRIAAVQL